MAKIKIRRITSATFPVDNSTDEQRGFAISANVTVSNGTVTNIDNGQVQRVDGTETHPASYIADFSRSNGHKSISTHGEISDAEDTAIRDAINAFIAAIRETDYSLLTESIVID